MVTWRPDELGTSEGCALQSATWGKMGGAGACRAAMTSDISWGGGQE